MLDIDTHLSSKHKNSQSRRGSAIGKGKKFRAIEHMLREMKEAGSTCKITQIADRDNNRVGNDFV